MAPASNSKLCVGLIGAEGRFGRAIQTLGSPSLNFQLFSRQNPLPPSVQVDVLLDVSSLLSLETHLNIALETKTALVIGVTGITSMKRLRQAAKSIPLFYSENFSVGIAVMRRAARHIAKRFESKYGAEIVDTHHAFKKDAPSGTSLLLKRSIESSVNEISIRSHREGDVVGKHELHFRAEDEHLILIHEAKNRNAFAKGAILAARFLAYQGRGFYTMDDLI